MNRKVNTLSATDSSQKLTREMMREKGRMKNRLATVPNVPGTPSANSKKMDKTTKDVSYLAKARYNLMVVSKGKTNRSR